MSAPANMLDFRSRVLDSLQKGDRASLLKALESDWPATRLIQLIRSGELSGVELVGAIRCLGMVGSVDVGYSLVALLGHPDAAIAGAAEDALWAIWMRAGSPRAVTQLSRAVELSRDEDFEGAVRILRQLVAAEPEFAEAHHQLALALHALDALEDADASYRDAIRRNPLHFAAFAGLGHICVARADLEGALAQYRRAVHLHPRLSDIRDILSRLDAAVQRRVVA